MPVFECVLSKQFPIFRAESLGPTHLIQQRTEVKFSSLSDSLWSKSSRNCCTAPGRTYSAHTACMLRVTPAMLLLQTSTLLRRYTPHLLVRPPHKQTALTLQSTLTTLEQNCANVDSNNEYCLGILTSVSFTTRLSSITRHHNNVVIYCIKRKVTPMHTMNTHRGGSKVFCMKSRAYREHPQHIQLLQ
jgi:hypothetical protein